VSSSTLAFGHPPNELSFVHTFAPKKRRRVARQELKDNLAKLQAAVIDTKKAHHTYANSAQTLDDDEEPDPSSSFDFASHATQLKAEIDSFMVRRTL
jgi:hypothetical protein